MSKKSKIQEFPIESENKFSRRWRVPDLHKYGGNDVYSDYSADDQHNWIKKVSFKEYQEQININKSFQKNLGQKIIFLPFIDPEDIEARTLPHKIVNTRHKTTPVCEENFLYDCLRKDLIDRKETSLPATATVVPINSYYYSSQNDDTEFDALLESTRTNSTENKQSFGENNKKWHKNKFFTCLPEQVVTTKQKNTNKPDKTTQILKPAISVTNTDNQFPYKELSFKAKNDNQNTSIARKSINIKKIHVPKRLGTNVSKPPFLKENAAKINPIQSRKSNTVNTQNNETALQDLYSESAPEELTSASEQHLQSHEIGFPNPPGSNRCWMNATLQFLLGMEPFIKDLCHHEDKMSCSHIFSAFVQIVRMRECSDISCLNSALETFYKSLQKLDVMFTSGEQLDAAEFMIKLLESFNESFENLISSSSLHIPNAVKENVEFKLENKISCTRCFTICCDEETHRMLLIGVTNLKKVLDLQQLIESYFTTERSCSSGCEMQCNVKTFFQVLPRFLIIQLKRYMMKDGHVQKVDHTVRIPVRLSMRKLSRHAEVRSVQQQSSAGVCSTEGDLITAVNLDTVAAKSKGSQDSQPQEYQDNDENNYRLIGTIIHRGLSLNSETVQLVQCQRRLEFSTNQNSS